MGDSSLVHQSVDTPGTPGHPALVALIEASAKGSRISALAVAYVPGLCPKTDNAKVTVDLPVSGKH